MSYPVAHDGNKTAIARRFLEARVNLAVSAQQSVIEAVERMVIEDALIAPADMVFDLRRNDIVVSLAPPPEGVEHDTRLRVHPHALGQVCGVFEYPRAYLTKLQKGCAGIPVNACRQKIVEDLWWHASRMSTKDRKGRPAKYLCRSVDGELRGFLSRSFKRHLASRPLLRAFVAACADAELVPMGASASPVRVNLQCVLPMVFSPVDGEYVAIGVSWSNSDFGGGRMKVSLFMERLSSRGSSAVLGDAISQVHIGPVIEESDIEMSEDTVRDELKAQRGAIRDAVNGQLSVENVEKLLTAVRRAHEEAIPWHRLKTELSKVLQKKEVEEVLDALLGGEKNSFEALPQVTFDDMDDPVATRYWGAVVLGQLAEREADAERKKTLQELAGDVIGRAK